MQEETSWKALQTKRFYNQNSYKYWTEFLYIQKFFSMKESPVVNYYIMFEFFYKWTCFSMIKFQ